jgi:hypothetical protein
MKGCNEEVMVVFLQAPNLVSAKTRFTDKSTKQLAIEFGMSDIKSTREGEHQEGFLAKKNKFTEKEYAQAEKYATRKKGVNKDRIKQESPQPTQEGPREARPGDSAVWGGGMQGMNMQSILAGRFSQPVGPSLGKEAEATNFAPSQAGIKTGPVTLPGGTLRDPQNLQIKK